MMTLCIRYCGSRQDAEDVLQEGFISVFDHLAAFRNDGAFEAWMRRIFVNASLSHLRKSHIKYETASLETVESDAEDASLTGQFAARELLEIIASLPAGYRIVFNLFAVEGYSHREIAGMLQISEATSRTQFFKARKALRTKLSHKEVSIS
ncbi:MAG: RNA polymerase sigma factor [Chitinophagales bacterium]|nr:RNA polymerase sigma factor [Chitinophagales bacterium]